MRFTEPTLSYGCFMRLTEPTLSYGCFMRLTEPTLSTAASRPSPNLLSNFDVLLQGVIRALRDHDDKIRVVLNKADTVSTPELARVYGAMMWSLSKAIESPEVVRVYLGSFRAGDLRNPDSEMAPVLRADQAGLLKDLRVSGWRALHHCHSYFSSLIACAAGVAVAFVALLPVLLRSHSASLPSPPPLSPAAFLEYHILQQLPRAATVRRINDLVKRARKVRVHAKLISRLREQLHWFWLPRSWHVAAWTKAVSDLVGDIAAVKLRGGTWQGIASGDLPDPAVFQDAALSLDIYRLHDMDGDKLRSLEKSLATELPELSARLSKEVAEQAEQELSMREALSDDPDNGHAAAGEPSTSYSAWAARVDKPATDALFRLQPGGLGGRIIAADAHAYLAASGSSLGSQVLRSIWDLSDINGDGALDAEEFAVLQLLLARALAGKAVPTALPPHLIPPSKRKGRAAADKAAASKKARPSPKGSQHS